MEPLARTPDGISPPSYQPSWEPPSLFPRTDGSVQVWLRDQPESPRGGYWTLNTLGCHSAVAASLSSVLEPEGLIPPKYLLSPKACQGILRRAEKRGKALPPMLDAALRSRSTSAAAPDDLTP